jgi:hypothetical protein
VPVDKACTPGGFDCAYPEGQCDCTYLTLTANGTPVWQCVTPPSSCPEPRPRIGSACTQDGLQCDYGACIGGAAVQCKDGIWQQFGVACPA